MTQNCYYAYIGTNSVRGSEGIYSLRIDAKTYVPQIVSAQQEYNVGSIKLSADDKYLYAGCEGMTFRGKADGGVAGYRVSSTGVLSANGYAYANGQRTCAIDTNDSGTQLYTASFFNGTLAYCQVDSNGAPMPARIVVESLDNTKFPPFMPKGLHCVRAIGEDYVGVISIVEGALIVYSAKDGRRITQYTFPDMAMIRWMEVCGQYIYVLMQSPGDVYVFKNQLAETGKIPLIQTISILPEGSKSRFDSTTIHAIPNGKVMLAASRAENSLTVFQVQENGLLSRKNVVSLPGETPRDFNISKDGKIVVVACQKSDAVCVLELDYEKYDLVYHHGCQVHVPSPAAVTVTNLM